jgi:hypothetical protein
MSGDLLRLGGDRTAAGELGEVQLAGLVGGEDHAGALNLSNRQALSDFQ